MIISLEKTEDGASLGELHVIDWEFVMCAPALYDLAHFAAEIWMDHKFDSNDANGNTSHRQALLVALFSAYRASGLPIDMKKVLYYIAGHVCCFSGNWPRSEDGERVSSVARDAFEIAMLAKAEEWDKLSQRPLIGAMMP